MKRPARPTVTPVDLKPSGSIRGAYAEHGAGTYYRQQGSAYRNPHELVVHSGIAKSLRRWTPDLSHVLDLAAGSGEATLALREAAAGRVDGIDPYTHEAYKQRIGCPAEQMTFEQIAAGGLASRHYSLIVCSFALHLCEASRLPGVCGQLAAVSPALLVLTPHKRPIIEPEWGWRLDGEQVWQRVRCRIYASRFCSGE